MKKILSFLLVLAMCITLITPFQTKEVQAAEGITVSTWTLGDLIHGDTYGIYPLTWYEKDLTGAITQQQLRSLYFGVRNKLVNSDSVDEVRFENLQMDESITVKEVLEVFYTLLSNYDYSVDMGLSLGLDPVTYMQQIGVYSGQNGEQGLEELCTTEQAMVIATRLIAIVYEAQDASSKGFLWELKSGKNTVYMLGSIHLASTDIYPFSNKLWQAFNSSDALVVEANLYDTQDVTTFMQMMYYTDGTTLKDHVSQEAYEAAIKAAAVMGITEEQAAYIKPWALYLTFESFTLTDASDNTLTAQLGIDMNLLTNAIIYQKPIYAIEGAQKQGMILDSFSAELQEYLLLTYSNSLINMASGALVDSQDDSNEETLDVLFDSWKDGDVEKFLQLYSTDGEDTLAEELPKEILAYGEEFNEKFFVQRDDAMADYIDKLLKAEGENTYFVVVGSLHYINEYSVLDRLVEKGYEFTQIK